MCTLPYACILTCTWRQTAVDQRPNIWNPNSGGPGGLLGENLEHQVSLKRCGKNSRSHWKSGSLRFESPFFDPNNVPFFDSPNGGFTNADQWENTPEAQWEFQDPKMGVLYHIRPYLVGIFPYIGLIIIGLICGWYLQFKILEWPLISRSLWASPQVWAVVLKTPSNRKICPFLTPSAPTGYQSSIHNGYIMIGCLRQISDIILRAHGYIDRYIHRYIDRYRYR